MATATDQHGPREDLAAQIIGPGQKVIRQIKRRSGRDREIAILLYQACLEARWALSGASYDPKRYDSALKLINEAIAFAEGKQDV